jgi:S-(hydroxymethyl)glutathione dehydrogenase/alcohol dehydrogenase
VQGAAIAGAGRIIAVDLNEMKLKMAEQFGATDLVDASSGDAVAQVQELTGGGVDFLGEKKIQGSNMGSNRFRIDMPRYIDMYLDGRLKLDELVSARIGLDDINDGFEAMKRGEVARSVIVFD